MLQQDYGGWTVKSVEVQWVCHTADSRSCDFSEGDVILWRGERSRRGRRTAGQNPRHQSQGGEKKKQKNITHLHAQKKILMIHQTGSQLRIKQRRKHRESVESLLPS